MVEPLENEFEDEEEVDFDDAQKEHDDLEAKAALEGLKVRQSYFKGKSGPLSVMKREKDHTGEGTDDCFVRGETTAASAI